MIVFGWLIMIFLAGLVLSFLTWLISLVIMCFEDMWIWPLQIAAICIIFLVATLFFADQVAGDVALIEYPAWASFMKAG